MINNCFYCILWLIQEGQNRPVNIRDGTRKLTQEEGYTIFTVIYMYHSPNTLCYRSHWLLGYKHMASKSVQHWVFSDEAKVAAERRKQYDSQSDVRLYTCNKWAEDQYVCLPIVPWMASAEWDVLHLEEVTTSVKLKIERDA